MIYPISMASVVELEEITKNYFQIHDYMIDHGIPVFIVSPISDTENSFLKLAHDAKRISTLPLLRWYDKDDNLMILRFIPDIKKDRSDIRINVILFLITLVTMSFTGYLFVSSPLYEKVFFPEGYTFTSIDFILGIVTFVLALMGIIATHELGHYFTCKHHGIEATLPYFIPGLPATGGTFGAFIMQKSPPLNRKQLFDMGISGPMAGFIVALLVSIIGVFLSVPLTAEQLANLAPAGETGELPTPILFDLLIILFVQVPENGTVLMHPIFFAGWVGMLVTGLNLFPIGQLDGGHVARAVLGAKYHKIFGYVSFIIMLIIGYWLMAFFVAIFVRSDHPGALDDVSKVSHGRIVLFLIALIILIITIPPLTIF